MGAGLDIATFKAKLDTDMYSIMETDVADAVKEEMSKNLESYTYKWSRGPNGGGVRDKRNFRARVEQNGDRTILNVKDEAPFQHRTSSGKSLAKVVETGDPAFHMPGPRPFIKPTQETMDDGTARSTIMQGLRARGYTVEET